MSQDFTTKLKRCIKKHDSLLCVGLDPDISLISGSFLPESSEAECIRAFSLEIIENTKDLVCCYKPNFAYFEQVGPAGLNVLRDIITAIPENIPVLLEAERSGTGNTAKAYARAAFEVWGADAITVNPYHGSDCVMPYLEHAGKTVFLICHTSNPTRDQIQSYCDTQPLYKHIVKQGQSWGKVSQIGFVVGATQPEVLAEVRRMAPERWILAPGIGAQGGDLVSILSAGLDKDSSGLIIPVSRTIIYADKPRNAAKELRKRINEQRAPRPSQHSDMIRALFDAGCIQFGNFPHSSGKKSPLHIDLQCVVSYPSLFQMVVDAYSDIVRVLNFDHLAAIPYAALPISAAIALRLNESLIYPRKKIPNDSKEEIVEGDFSSGQVAVPLEEVIGNGKSVLKNIQLLESVNLSVHDIVVLIDHEHGGEDKLSTHGYRLHSILTINEVLTLLYEENFIDTLTYRMIKNYRGREIST